jgi:hypothetical protein
MMKFVRGGWDRGKSRDYMISRAGVSAGKTVVLLAGLLMLGTGCGKKAPPFLPEPVPARDLQVGRILVGDGKVTFDVRIPRERFQLGREEDPWILARILRSEDGGGAKRLFVERGVISQGAGFPFGEWQTFEDEGLQAGEGYTYRIDLRKKRSREWASTGLVTFAVTKHPGSPVKIHSEGREGAITLNWEMPSPTPGGLTFDLFRREGGEQRFERVNRIPLEKGSYTDAEVEKEKEYCYRVRAVIKEGIVEVPGELSPEECASSVDRTPPPSPTGLILIFDREGSTLSWLPVEARDLGGYYVYRAVGDGPFVRINSSPHAGTRYRDGSVEGGATYGYRVTAVDNSAGGNESPFSETVRGTPANP